MPDINRMLKQFARSDYRGDANFNISGHQSTIDKMLPAEVICN